MKEKYNVVSLFAGIGGICLGFKQAGFNIVWANEKDKSACNTYRYNFGNSYLVEENIKNIDENSIPQANVLVAGFPCQSFSIAGAQKGFNDPRGELFFDVVRVAKRIKPNIIFLENVENLIEHDKGRTFQIIYASLVELGYIIKYQPMPTHEYANIPQTRRRIYIVAFKSINQADSFAFPDRIPLTCSISDIINPHDRKPEIYYYCENNSFDKYINQTVTDSRYLYRVFNGSVRKLTNSKCPTITASMTTKRNAAVLRDDFGVRRLTLREELDFQGFPNNFCFPSNTDLREAYKQIGNSVTVPLICRIAKRIKTNIDMC